MTIFVFVSYNIKDCHKVVLKVEVGYRHYLLSCGHCQFELLFGIKPPIFSPNRNKVGSLTEFFREIELLFLLGPCEAKTDVQA